jgi:hypothetical protein
VTHCGAGPGPGACAKSAGIQQSFGSTAKNAAKYAIAVDLGWAEIWPGQRLVNGAKLSRISSF